MEWKGEERKPSLVTGHGSNGQSITMTLRKADKEIKKVLREARKK